MYWNLEITVYQIIFKNEAPDPPPSPHTLNPIFQAHEQLPR